MRRAHYWNLPRRACEDEEAYQWRAGAAYFQAQAAEIAEWWRRIGTMPDLQGARVLEIGCGHGALCLDAVRRGAARVTGVDTDAKRIRFGCEYLGSRHPREAAAITLVATPVQALPAPDAAFDAVLSKDTFEHLDDPASVVAAVERLLRPGGLFVCGFSPLYYSPNGDHGRFRLPAPWLHAILPEPLALRWASRRLGRPLESPRDVGLNRLTLPSFRDLLPGLHWETLSLRVNPMAHPLRPAFDLLRRVPALERYFTVGVYGVFRRRPSISSR